MSRWPSALEYSQALQSNADRVLRHPELSETEFRSIPLMGSTKLWSATGAFATVFEGRRGAERFALRAYNRDPGESRTRYQMLERHRTTYQQPFVASAHWLDEAIEIDGQRYPAMKMEWVDGLMLHDYVHQHLDEPMKLVELADQWRKLSVSLREQRMAHGDLQTRNILVTAAGQLKLVDLDGIWLPSLDAKPPLETGHPHFQHPHRQKSGIWHEYVDGFSSLVIYLSLRALAVQPTLWDLFNEENLILTRDDYLASNVGRTPAWERLRQVPEPGLQEHVDILQTFCWADAHVRTDLPEILEELGLFTRADDPRVTGAPTDRPGPSAAPPPPTGGDAEPWFARMARERDTGPIPTTPPAPPPPTPPTGDPATDRTDRVPVRLQGPSPLAIQVEQDVRGPDPSYTAAGGTGSGSGSFTGSTSGTSGTSGTAGTAGTSGTSGSTPWTGTNPTGSGTGPIPPPDPNAGQRRDPFGGGPVPPPPPMPSGGLVGWWRQLDAWVRVILILLVIMLVVGIASG